ncbi:MAG: type IX secretion system PorP/SprF family membrane protein, partial [Flavobacteriales bacterium]
MKVRFVITLLIIAFCQQADAQQLPLYSNYVLNYFQMNPAVAGSKPCLDMKLGYRRQWAGISEAPETAFGNIHGSFGKKKHNFHGLGGQVVNDDAGPLAITGLNIAYAYHMKMNRNYYLSAGFGLGFMQYRVDVGTIVLPDVQFINDPAFKGRVSEFLFPQIQFGLWLYKNDRFYGFSIQNVVENNFESIGLDSKMQRHFTFAAGKNVEMQDGF